MLPAMPLDLVKGCPDVPVDPDALRALVEHRRALADCRRLQARTVDFYVNAKRNVEGAPD